jgi:hypothetical protein
MIYIVSVTRGFSEKGAQNVAQQHSVAKNNNIQPNVWLLGNFFNYAQKTIAQIAQI